MKVYLKYTSKFEKKYIWNIWKIYFLYNFEFEYKYINLESLLQVYLSLKVNASILKVYLKYTSKFEKKYIWKIWKIYFLYIFEFEHKYISLESLLQVYFEFENRYVNLESLFEATSQTFRNSTSSILLGLKINVSI